MNYNQFKNISCYEEFEIQCDLTGISKIDILRKIGNKKNNYYFFVSNDGIFNWFDLEGNHIEDPGVLKKIKEKYIPKNMTKCIIPDSVTSIDDGAFSFCESLQSITLPNNVTSIGVDAFYYCESLQSITLPNNVTSIGVDAFYYCESLKEIIVPDSVTHIGDGVFYDCKSLKEITIPDSVKRIGKNAFSYCKSLESITIPNNVTSISYGTFSFCDSLKEVIFKGKTLEEVKRMEYYPFGIEDESIIKVSEMI